MRNRAALAPLLCSCAAAYVTTAGPRAQLDARAIGRSPPPLRQPLPLARPQLASERRVRRAPPPVLLSGGDVLGAAGTLAAVGLLGYGILSGAIPLLVFLSGDPEERDRSGANENALFKEFVLKITPSAWKKAYQGDNLSLIHI